MSGTESPNSRTDQNARVAIGRRVFTLFLFVQSHPDWRYCTYGGGTGEKTHIQCLAGSLAKKVLKYDVLS